MSGYLNYKRRRVAIRPALLSGNPSKRRVAYTTAAKGLYIHAAVERGLDGWWTVSTLTGVAVASAPSLLQARKLAGALGGLPFQWRTIPSIYELTRRWWSYHVLDIPPEIARWCLSLRHRSERVRENATTGRGMEEA